MYAVLYFGSSLQACTVRLTGILSTLFVQLLLPATTTQKLSYITQYSNSWLHNLNPLLFIEEHRHIAQKILSCMVLMPRRLEVGSEIVLFDSFTGRVLRQSIYIPQLHNANVSCDKIAQ